jgi:organic hydroperoxide reductase OsmC/OhrA
MQSFPHHYRTRAAGRPEGELALEAPGLARIAVAPPAEFDGPGDQWSPETLLVAAVVDCFGLTFRAVARASSFEWIALRCEGTGELDRVDRTTRFTRIALRAFLEVPAPANPEKATRLLEKAERSCLITNSLVCPVELEVHVNTAGAPRGAEARA